MKEDDEDYESEANGDDIFEGALDGNKATRLCLLKEIGEYLKCTDSCK